MLRKREIVFKETENPRLHINNGSLFHGYLMENFSAEFSASMHQNSLRPFSQYLWFSRTENRWVWTVNSVSDSMNAELDSVLEGANTIEIRNKGWTLEVDHIRTYPGQTYLELTRECYEGPAYNNIIVDFITPCCFKVSGRNVVMPEAKIIYNNLLNRWNAFADTISIDDKDAFENIVQHTEVREFNIRTRNYSLEAAVVKGFEGRIHFRVSGPEPLVSLCNLIFRFAGYSGIGSRTALGMGGIKVEFR